MGFTFVEFGTLASAFSEAFLEAITRGGALRWQISQLIYDHLVGGLEHFGIFCFSRIYGIILPID